MIYITSDLHIGHDKEFMFNPRGFESIQEHDEQLVKNWNELITNEDIVYILGDVMLNDISHGLEIYSKLNGTKKLLIGNHDTPNRLTELSKFSDTVILGYADMIKYDKKRFYLSHYPTLTGNHDDDKMWNRVINLCGHIHTQNKWYDWDKGFIYHCELDCHENRPVSLDQIIMDIIDIRNRMFIYTE